MGVTNEMIHEKPKWYIKTNRGYKINVGILARHLINNIPILCIGNDIYIYENGVYKLIDRKLLEVIVKNYIEDEYARMQDIKNTVDLWIRDELIQKSASDLNNNHYLVNVKNGIIDLKNNEFIKHSHKFRSSIQLNVNYNPLAECDNFYKFTKKVLPDIKDMMLAQEVFGYALTLLTAAEKLFIIYGQSRTGKSTFLSLIEELVGSKYISHVPLQNLNDRFSKAQLFGKIVNIFADLPAKGLNDTGIIKALVGRDMIQAEKKNKDPFDFKNRAKFIFASNSLPDICEESVDAMFRRLVIIPFNNQVSDEEIDPNLKELLIKEKEGILNWALGGALRLIANNFKFTESKLGMKILQQYKLESNSALMFIEEKCVMGTTFDISKSHLHKAYNEFCNRRGIKPISPQKFKKILINKYPSIREKQQGKQRIRSYVGLKLKEGM